MFRKLINTKNWSYLVGSGSLYVKPYLSIFFNCLIAN